MRRVRIAIILLALVSAGGSQAFATPPESRGRDNRCYAVRVEGVSSSMQEAKGRRRYRRRFLAHEVLDLELSVWLPARSDVSVAEIRVYTPTDRLYDVLQATANTTTTEDGARYRGRKARVMSARLPVAGSHITNRSLYGTWRAEVFLDGNERGCTRRATEFTIEP